MARYGVEYVSKYRCSTRARQVLKALGTSTNVVVDWTMFNALTSAGFDLVPERDNKSVWTSAWIREGLSKFGDNLPTSLEEWELGSFSADRYSASQLGRVPRQRPFSEGDGATANPGTRAVGRRTFGSASNSTPRNKGSRQAVVDRRADVLPDRGAGSVGDSPLRIDSRVYEHAKAATRALAGNRERGRQPLSMDEVVGGVVHMRHFASAPYFCSNELALDRALRDAKLVAEGTRAFDPYVAGRRVQHGASGSKGRLVWMAPLSTTLLASRYSKAIYDGVKRLPVFAFATRRSTIGAVLSEFQTRFQRVYSLDFSGFDARVPARLIDDAFDILSTWLDIDDEDEQILARVIHDFIHSRIVLPDQSMWQVHRGVPSGNPFTSLVGSVVNLLVLNYMWIKTTGVALRADRVMILGDDSVFATNDYVSLHDLASAASDLGMVVSTEKSTVAARDSGVDFLGHNWSHGRPHRPLWDLAIRMAFPERHLKRTKADSWLRFFCYSADADEWIELLYMIRHKYGSYMDMVQVLLRDSEAEVVNLESAPGYLRYLEAVEPERLDASVRAGPALAVYGLLV